MMRGVWLSLYCLILLYCFASSNAQDGGQIAGDNVTLKIGTIKFTDIDIHYNMYDTHIPEDGPVVLFLHGARFTSEDWIKIGTLKYLSDKGYKTVAIDLPGHGKTPDLPYSDNNAKAELVKTVFEAVSSKKSTRILVSPSMSGRYAFPYLERYGMELNGWVALAPVGVKSWGGPYEFIHRKVRLLAVYGELDPLLPDMKNLAKVFSTSFQKVIPKAGHPCYVEKPDIFHLMLSEFLRDTLRAVELEKRAAEKPKLKAP